MSLILLVDDDPDVRLLCRRSLEKLGHEVHEAANGRAGLERAGKLRPDLVLTDVQMPDIDGWELVRRLRRQGELALVPVLFLTAQVSPEERLRGFRLGADAYLTKPFRLEELEVIVTNALARSAAHRAALQEQLGRSREAELSGELTELGLGSVLSLLELETKTGILEVQGEDHRGSLSLADGRLLAVRLEGSDTVGVEALSYLLGNRRGSFAFHACSVQVQDEMACTTTGALMDATRLLDERNA